jgi:uncharacterized protein YcbK (DUF882 family)
MQPRREFLRAASAFLLSSLAVPAWAGEGEEAGTTVPPSTGDVLPAPSTSPANPSPLANETVRSLAFDNLHTGEKLKLDYWLNGDYVPDALTAIDRLLRDFRTGEVHAIEPKLLDLLSALHSKLGSAQPFQVISGYRSPATSAMLCAETSGVNPKSLQMSGQAIDIFLEDRALTALRDAARALNAGGVGFYPHFVHVDVGPVQWW